MSEPIRVAIGGEGAEAAAEAARRPPSQKARPAAVVEEEAADAEDDAFDLLAVPGCAAHLVCEVHSCCMGSEPTPRVQAHNVLFCRVTRAYVDRAYWLNGHNFIPVAAHTPPYLTFLGSGNFGHVVNPAHSAKQWAQV